MSAREDATSRGADRLRRALDLFVAGGSRERLLNDHPDLADLIAPMFDGEATGSTETAGPQTASEMPREIGEFQILGVLGRGGMGIVYEAFQPALGRKVALKVLPAIANADPHSVANFRREASIAAAIEHPGIVKIFALGHSSAHHWIAMELVAGGSLAERARELSERGVAECVATIAAVADALAVAHEQGLVHRDVKPANILLRPDRTPVLTDFGLARNLGTPSITQTGGFVGTPYYASPEHETPKLVDARSDVFSLGATLYVLLTGERPFPGETTHEVLERIRRDPPKDPARLRSTLPDDLCAIVLKALEKEPARRYQSARDFARDLRAFLAFEPVSARRPSPWARAARFVRRKPLQTLLGAALVALLGAGTYILANLDVVRAGEQVAAEAAIERALVETLRERLDHRVADGITRLEHELTVHPDHEELVGALVFLDWIESGAKGVQSASETALARLRAHPIALERSVPLRRLEAMILAATGAKDRAAAAHAALGEPRLALEFYFMGRATQLTRNTSDPHSDRASLGHLRRALLASERPRLELACEFTFALREHGDRAGIADAEALLTAHWPNEPETWTWIGIAAGAIDPEISERACRKAIALDPDADYAWHGLGLALRKLGRRAEGEEAVLTSIRKAKQGWLADTRRADLLLSKGEFREGLEVAQRVLAARPSSRQAILLCALGKLHVGGAQAAEAMVSPLYRSRPLDPEVRKTLASIFLAQSRFTEVVELLEPVVGSQPWAEVAWFEYGTALAALNRHEQARTALERSITLDPQHANAHQNLGNLFFEMGKYEEALRSTRRALELNPRLADAWNNGVRILQRTKDFGALGPHLDAWIAARPEDGMPFVYRAQRVLGKQPFHRETDGVEVSELARKARTVQPSLELTALGLEVDLHAAQKEWSAALAKLAEVRAAARRAGWKDEVIRRTFDGLESHLRREGRKSTAQSRPSSGPETRR